MRQLDITDGYTSASAPTTIDLLASGLQSYANDAAFVTANGTATDGDCYYNTTDDTFHCYTDGAWTELVTTADVQTIINKKLSDSTTTIIDNSDNTKVAKFEVSGITTGTTRTFTFPDADTTFVGLTNTQTLTNKTLTSPVLNTPSLPTYADFTHSTTPANPSAGALRVYAKNDNKLYTLTSGGVETEIGAGGGGGGGTALRWVESTNAPTPVVENNLIVYEFDPDTQQEIYAMVKVPQSYVAGTQAFLYFDFYSAGTSNTVHFKVLSTLIRAGTDQVSSTTNQYTSTNSAVALAAGTVDEPQSVAADITNASGQINSVAIAAGDRIFLKLYRDVANDTSTVAAKGMLDGSEVTFA